MGRGIKGEVFDFVCAARTLSHAQLRIELKPHTAVEAAPALQEAAPAYKVRMRKKASRGRSSCSRPPEFRVALVTKNVMLCDGYELVASMEIILRVYQKC